MKPRVRDGSISTRRTSPTCCPSTATYRWSFSPTRSNPHKTVAENIGFPLKVRKISKADMDARHAGCSTAGADRAAAGTVSARVVRGATAARRAGPCHHPAAFGLSDGRAVVQSGCQAARPHARAAKAHAEVDGDHDDLCDPRSDRGDDPGAPCRDPGERRSAATRDTGRGLQRSRQSVRRPVHRIAADERRARQPGWRSVRHQRGQDRYAGFRAGTRRR